MLPYMVHSMLCVMSMWALFHQFGDEVTSSCVGWCPGDVTSFHVLFFFLSFFSPDTVLFQVNVCFSNRSHFLFEGILFPCMLEPGGGGEGQHEHVWMYWCGQMNEFFFGDTGSVMFICNMLPAWMCDEHLKYIKGLFFALFSVFITSPWPWL